MKKIILPLVLLISFMLLFIGCPPAEEEGPTDEEQGIFSDIEQFAYPLPSIVGIGDTVDVHITGEQTGTSGFRVWISDGWDANSNFETYNTQGVLDYDTPTLTVTKDAQDRVLIKGPSPGTNIDSLEIDTITVDINGGGAVSIDLADVILY